VPVRRGPRLLDGVLGLRVVAQDGPNGPEKTLVVAPEDQLEELDLSRADPGDGFFVRENGEAPFKGSEAARRERLQTGGPPPGSRVRVGRP
jgi:hypothetical protein